MPERVNYFRLATHLQALPLSATCGDLAASLAVFFENAPEQRNIVLTAIGDLPPEAEWFAGLDKLCYTLQQQNPRFIPGLFMDWTLEGK